MTFKTQGTIQFAPKKPGAIKINPTQNYSIKTIIKKKEKIYIIFVKDFSLKDAIIENSKKSIKYEAHLLPKIAAAAAAQICTEIEVNDNLDIINISYPVRN